MDLYIAGQTNKIKNKICRRIVDQKQLVNNNKILNLDNFFFT